MEAGIKKELLEQINDLKKAVETDDVEMLVSLIDDMAFDIRYSTPIIDFTRELIIAFISNYIKEKSIDVLRVKRLDVYRIETFDSYQMSKGALFRNGHDTKWDSIGKLYKAYKYIKTLKSGDL